MTDLEALASRVEAESPYDPDLRTEVLAVFGWEHRYVGNAGWKCRKHSYHWCSPLRPMSDLRDFCTMVGPALPDMIPSCPRKATAAALRALAKDKP